MAGEEIPAETYFGGVFYGIFNLHRPSIGVFFEPQSSMNFDGETAVGGDAIAAVLMGVGHSNLVTMRMTAFLEPTTEVHVITFLGHCILDGQIRLFNQLFIGVPAVPVGMHVRHSHFTTLPVPMVPAPVAPAPVAPPDEDLPAGANIPADDFLEGILANGL